MAVTKELAPIASCIKDKELCILSFFSMLVWSDFDFMLCKVSFLYVVDAPSLGNLRLS